MNSKSVKEGGKHNMYSKSKRFIASFLAVLMAVCMLPMDIFGAVGVAYAEAPTLSANPVSGSVLTSDNTTVTLTAAGATKIVYATTDASTYDSIDADALKAVTEDATGIKIVTGATASVDISEIEASTKAIKAIAVTVTPGESGGEDTVEASGMETFTYTIDTRISISNAEITLSTTTPKEGDAVPTVTKVEIPAATEGGTATEVQASEYDVTYTAGTSLVDVTLAEKEADLKALPADTVVTVKVSAKGTTYKDSATKNYTVQDNTPVTVAVPTVSKEGEVTSGETVTLGHTDNSAEIYYVLKTAEEAATAPTVNDIVVAANKYTTGTPIAITEASSIFAVAQVGGVNSDVKEFKYTIKAAGEANPFTVVLDFDKFTATTTAQSYNDGYFSIESIGAIEQKNVASTTANPMSWTSGKANHRGYKTGGIGTAASNPGRMIKFTPTSNVTITVGAVGSGDSSRNIGYQNLTELENDSTADKTVIKESTAVTDKSNVTDYTYNLIGDGKTEYAIAFSNGFAIYYVIAAETDYAVKPPVASEPSGAVQAGTKVTFKAPAGVDIYLAEGETVDVTDANKYTAGTEITIDEAKKITVVAKVKDTNAVSAPVTYNYTIAQAIAATPTANVASGIYDEEKSVTLSSTTANAKIYYTTDGTNPIGNEDAIEATGAITVDKTQTIKAYAKSDATQASEVLTLTYIIKSTATKTYCVKPSEVNGEPTVPAEGGEIYVGTDNYFRLLYKDPGANIFQKVSAIVSSGNPAYNVGTMQNWPTSEAGALDENSKALIVTGGTITDNNKTAVKNAVKIIVSAPAKLTAYHAVKNGTETKLQIFKASKYDDTELGTQINGSTTVTSTNAKVGKEEVNLTEAGVYYIGFASSGGIIPYIEVTENPSASTEDKVTLTFMNGSEKVTEKEVTKGEKYTFADADKLADTADKKFKGWATTNDATATVITEITPTADTDLYAVWANLYTVTLDTTGASETTFPEFPKTVEEGTEITLPTPTPADNTLTFGGWKESDATGENIPTYTGEYTVTKDVTLVPVFVDPNSIFTVTRDYGYAETGSSANKTDVFTVTKAASGKATVTLLQLGTPTRDGYTFANWVILNGDAEGSAVTADVEIEANTTFLAKWTKNPEMYTVAFKDAEGNVVTTNPVIETPVAENTDITLPTTTNTKTDYDFEGWKINGEGSVLIVGATYKVVGNVTFVESWKAKEGPVTPPTPSDIPTNEKIYVRFVDAEGDEVDPDDEYSYTGAKVEPKVEVYNYGRLLTLGTDYTVKYKNNINAGTNASITVSGKGNLSGAANVITFAIKPADIKAVAKYPESMTVAVNAKVAPAIMHGTKKLGNKDFTLEGTELDTKGKYATAGDYTLTVKGKGNYAESSSFTIDVKVVDKKSIQKLNVAVDTKTAKNFKYGEFSVENISDLVVKPAADNGGDTPAPQADGDETGVTPIITVTNKDKKVLKEGEDFVIYTASSLNDAGTVKFTVVGMGEYGGTVNKSFKIQPAKITDTGKFKVSFKEKDYEYKASGVTVEDLEVRYLGEAATQADGDDGILLTPGVDYKAAYSNNKKVSTETKKAQIKITFLGNYKGSKAKTEPFTIVTAKMDAENTVVVVPEKIYSKGGKSYKSTPIVMVDGTAIKASNYTVHYSWKAESVDTDTYTDDDKVKITLGEEDTCAHVKVKIEPKANASYAAATVGDTAVTIEGEYYVVKAGDKAIDLSKAKVVFTDKSGNVKKSLDYNGKPFYTPGEDGAEPLADEVADDPNAVYVKVTVKGAEVSSDLYTVEWTNAKEKGKATVVVTGTWQKDADGNYAIGSKNASISIKPMKIAKTALPSNKKPVVAEAIKDALDKLF